MFLSILPILHSHWAGLNIAIIETVYHRLPRLERHYGTNPLGIFMNEYNSDSLRFEKSTSIPIQYVYLLIRIGLGLVFIFSGVAKLMAPQSFSVIIEAYGLIPEITVFPVAVIIAMIEALAGIGLLIDVRGSLEIITALIIFFMLVLAYGLWLGLDVDCGCFGAEEPEAEAFHDLRPALYRDLVMLVGIIFLFFWRHRQKIIPLPLKTIIEKVKTGGKQG